MERLSTVIIFTGDLAGTQRFYESVVGLTAHPRSAERVEFDTAGATLVLHATPDPTKRGVQLRFATDDLEARLRVLSERGVTIDPPGIESFAWGKLASLLDSEGNLLTFWEPAGPEAPRNGPALSVVVNCRDLTRTKAYYRDTLGFPTTVDSPWWVELSVGEAGMGLHPLVERPTSESHQGRPITIGLAVPGLLAWVDDARERGLEFDSPPTDRGFGTFADAEDPEGNPVTFRDAPEPETLEEQLAEPFDDEGTPRRAAIRKPIKKGATGGSRLSLKPVRASTSRRTRKPAAKVDAARSPAKRTVDVVSPRGTGPAGERRKPKRVHDPKRARAKPAIGRLRKAERRTLARKKLAVASASKTKPVKRASRPLKGRTPTTRTRR